MTVSCVSKRNGTHFKKIICFDDSPIADENTLHASSLHQITNQVQWAAVDIQHIRKLHSQLRLWDGQTCYLHCQSQYVGIFRSINIDLIQDKNKMFLLQNHFEAGIDILQTARNVLRCTSISSESTNCSLLLLQTQFLSLNCIRRYVQYLLLIGVRHSVVSLLEPLTSFKSHIHIPSQWQ